MTTTPRRPYCFDTTNVRFLPNNSLLTYRRYRYPRTRESITILKLYGQEFRWKLSQIKRINKIVNQKLTEVIQPRF